MKLLALAKVDKAEAIVFQPHEVAWVGIRVKDFLHEDLLSVGFYEVSEQELWLEPIQVDFPVLLPFLHLFLLVNDLAECGAL